MATRATKVAGRAPAPQASPSPFHETLAGLDDLAANVQHRLADATRAIIAKGAQGGVKEQVTLADGTHLFRKAFSPDDRRARDIVDAEQLAAIIGQAIGAPIARVYRADDLDLYTDWQDGTALYVTRRRKNGQARTDAVLDSREAQRLGLLDMLVGNHDRHEANMIVDKDEKLRGIDHGLAWNGARWVVEQTLFRENRMLGFLQGPGRRHFGDPNNSLKLGPNPMTPADVVEIRQRLTAMRPQFERLDRGMWLDYSLIVLDILAAHASGTESILA